MGVKKSRDDRSLWRSLAAWIWGVAGTIVVTVAAAWAVHAFGPSNSPDGKPGLPLAPAPSSWGRTLPGSSGRLFHRDNQRGVFAGEIELSKLEANHQYFLSLNGKPPHPSDALLPKRTASEGYVDFTTLSTDGKGNVKAAFSVNLPAGTYEVKFFVKDPKDWKVVLYNDLLHFTVQ